MATPASVEEYMARVPQDRRRVLEEIRATIRAAAPDATETISYQMPAFRNDDGFLVWYAAFKNHFSIFPATDGVIAALGDELRPHLSGKGTIRFAADEPLPTALVTKIVGVRVKENAASRRR